MRRQTTQIIIMARMKTARATDRDSMMMIPCREELSGIFQPVGNDERSKLSIDDGSSGKASSCPAAVGQGHCFFLKKKGSVGVDARPREGITHGTLSRAIQRPFSFMPVTVISQDVLVWHIKPTLGRGWCRWWSTGGCIGA